MLAYLIVSVVTALVGRSGCGNMAGSVKSAGLALRDVGSVED